MFGWRLRQAINGFQTAHYARVRAQLSREVQHLRYKLRSILSEADLLMMLEKDQLPPQLRYRHFTIPKKDGSPRHLAEPNPNLKIVQHEMLRAYLHDARVHRSAVGYRRKHSIVNHVWPHVEANIIITADIRDFFPSTTRYRVQKYWEIFHPEDVAHILTLLSTYRGSLPQGAPTSPALSNAVNYEMDAALDRRVQDGGGNYTRYADDLVFSWYDHVPTDFEQAVRSILREYGYELNDEKGWQVYSRHDEPMITGLVLSKRGTVDIPPQMKKIMRELKGSARAVDQARFVGYQSYAAMVQKRPAKKMY